MSKIQNPKKLKEDLQKEFTEELFKIDDWYRYLRRQQRLESNKHHFPVKVFKDGR